MIRPLLLTALMGWAAAAAHAQAALKIESAWARPTVVGQSAGGAYLRITGGPAADRLLAASAPVAANVELHTMSMDGDVMRMRPVEGVAIGAGRTVELKPGGQHLMLMGLAQPLKSGSRFPLILRFEKAGERSVQVLVTTQRP